MRKYSRRILALGAFFVVAASLAACGSGVPGDSVADVAGNPITTQAFNHWMYVAAKSQASQSPGSPIIVPSDPPDFSHCVAQVRREIPALAKTATKTIRGDCKQLFTSLSSQVMDFLVKAYWYQAEAARNHINVTDAQANAAKKALQSGKSWNQVAKQYSSDPTSKNRGGLLTGVQKGQQDAALDKAAFVAPTNHLIGPVHGQFGYYLFEVVAIKQA